MANISIAEFFVYGLLTYSSMLVLIFMNLKSEQEIRTRSGTLIKTIFLMPGLICAPVIATSGPDIFISQVDTANLIKSINTTQTWTETTVQSHAIPLQNDVWLTVHMLIFFILLIYIVVNLLKFLMAEP